MATPTSSSNRSKRKTNKPVTQGQNPQRANRQKVSNAKVSNSEQRTNTGSAKVTTSKSPKPSDPWKTPTPKTSRTSAPSSNTQFRTGNKPITLPNSRAQGTNLPRAGAQQLRSATQGPKAGTKPPTVKPSGSYKAPSIPKPSTAAPKPTGRVGALGVGRLNAAAALLGAANYLDDMRLTDKQRGDKYKVVDPNRGQRIMDDVLGRNKPATKSSNSSSSTGVRVSDKTNKRDYQAAPTGSKVYNDYRNQQIAAERQRLKGVGNPPAAKSKPPAPTQSGGGSTQSRSGGGGSSRPADPRREAAPPTQTGPKRLSAATANRESGNYGTSRTNNPMIDADMKARMRQREDREGVGPVKDGNRYAADVRNNTQGVGPVANADTYGSSLKQPSASEKLKQTLKEKQDEAKKRQRDNLLRAAGSSKPGSRS